jgi:tocopherol cyclase
MIRKTKPSDLRGNFDRKKYFEGWFHKIYSQEHRASFVIIYGYTTGDTPAKFGFIQVHLPNQEPRILYFDRSEVSCDPNQHRVCMGVNELSLERMKIRTEELIIDLHFGKNDPIRTVKNSMGYHYFIPNLPCYHAVCNLSHTVSGEIRTTNDQFSFKAETGYLEKNWGTSFPENYQWLHAIAPNDPATSLLFSQAEIGWFGNQFQRHVGYIRIKNEVVDFRRLKDVSIRSEQVESNKQRIHIRSRELDLEITIITDQQVFLLGPEDGTLRRNIGHYADAQVELRITRGSETTKLNLVGNFEDMKG